MHVCESRSDLYQRLFRFYVLAPYDSKSVGANSYMTRLWVYRIKKNCSIMRNSSNCHSLDILITGGKAD